MTWDASSAAKTYHTCPTNNQENQFEILDGIWTGIFHLIANLCLFSNIRKGRLLYIRPVGRLVAQFTGWLVGRSTSPLIVLIYAGIKALY